MDAWPCRQRRGRAVGLQELLYQERPWRFRPGGLGRPLGILAYITLRKCGKRKRFARRRAGTLREVPWPAGNADVAWLPDRAPTPLEAATLNDTVELLFQAMKPDDRPIVEQILMGCTTEQVAKQLHCSERTVRRVRQRAKHRLRRLIGGEINDAEAG